jgi:hypothetical protein
MSHERPEGPTEPIYVHRATEAETERLNVVVPEDRGVVGVVDMPSEPTTEPLVAPGGVDVPPTELRVHGVSGTPPEDMLDRHILGQVAGDREAGFWRPRTEYGATLGPGGARLEAYRWGNLTAGAAARAFWLLLLPFTLANVAMWLRPPAKGAGRRIVHGLCRIFALTISATFTFAAIGIGMDLVAWQCAAPENACLDDRPLIAWFFTGFFEPTGRRIALGALGPIFVVSLLWFLAQRTWARYESYQAPVNNPDGDGLATITFWDGRAQVGRLRSLHVAAMFALIDGVLLFVLLRHDRGTDSYAGVDLAGVPASTVVSVGGVLAGAAVAIVALSLLLLMVPAMVDRVSRSRTASRTAKGLRWMAVILTALTMVYALLPRAPWPIGGPLPGYADTVTFLFAAQAGVLGLLTLVVLFQRHRCKGAFLGGFGTPVVASLALGLAAALSTGVSYRVADYLDGAAVPSPAEFGARPRALSLEPPLNYQWAALGVVLLLAVVILAFMWTRLVTLRILRRRARPDTDDDYAGGRQRDPWRARVIDREIADARLTDHVSRPLAVAWFIVATAGLAATVLAVAHVGPVEMARSGSLAADVLSFTTNAGTYLISISVLGLILLGIQTYRNARVRRTVGVIWDLATFWPRAAHPLAPPCYAERVVPELVHRATWLATSQRGLVLSGHSQGSVLVAAAVLQLPPEARRRTALLTYGSPLCRLYMRAFPNYFSEKVVNDIAAAVAGPAGQERWVNLWRRTDPIGGAIGIGDRRLADPASFDPQPGHRLPPAVQGHSGYQLTPQFGQAMDDLVGLLRAGDGPPSPNGPPSASPASGSSASGSAAASGAAVTTA